MKQDETEHAADAQDSEHGQHFGNIGCEQHANDAACHKNEIKDIPVVMEVDGRESDKFEPALDDEDPSAHALDGLANENGLL